ncbi:serine/threonine protein kinase [Rubidibacter lacunae KORDI 51-2]|uniref:non-specific serine/threonine protein kinase n=1 Tax=Rubidibacter lacunae KORDI 51-2 TaxID=582515 RepID=U5DIJ7_9CHRO|nr:serine/threonine-protein kinase [Rubidibacter lacunae]ERN41491.1 serine/threonine protein kinase [Rubidibacter lacunae KORDI 51-2]
MVERVVGGHYKIVQELGRGAFGQTFLAQDLENPTYPRCVVKELKPLADDELTLREAKRLFAIEAQVLAKLGDHPQVPELLAFYQDEFYLVQEYIDGHDLSKEIESGQSMSEENVVKLLRDILPVLEFIHDKNVIHRDLKPSNIRRRKDGQVVLIDFGAVKEIKTIVLSATGQPKPSIVAGTQGYMPPEQLRGRPRPNSDLYALGLIAIQALTGKSPMQLEEDLHTGDIVWRHYAPQVSAGLSDVLDRMIRSDFTERFQCAREVLDELEANIQTRVLRKLKRSVVGKKRRRRWWPTIAAGAVVAAGIGLFPFGQAIVRYNQANALALDGKYREALDVYDRVLETFPNAARAWLNKGFMYSQLKLFEEQLDACEHALESDPEMVEAFNCKGLALQRLGKSEEAVAMFVRTVELDSQFYQAWNNKGEALMTLGRPQEALDAFDRAKQYNPDYLFAWNNRGNALVQLERYAEAVASYSAAIKIDASYPYAWNGRGVAKREQQRYERALEDFTEATRLDRGFYEAWYNQGLALLALERLEGALDALDTAIAVKPDYRAAIVRREEVLEQLGQ